ncbi:MAG: hypothetical protein IPH05_11325 [Flavobacteriales bacterium]|jgi:hypothetical protein|nr:hypothetical protein [Flavobacteriales bacterium]MBK6549796.1 hypothetical protein [Flavobacteriales bacterium]MBK6883516.1 hypothetical protein [Flavobacteriales bacterium]MBK7102314.1 hypothetical protein [Flavobacteriales bacterium]MBK7113052.1 hypothetical protein [Flavobacteriales bacterium]
MSPNDLSLVAKHVMKLLVERRFDELEAATNATRLSAEDIEGAVEDIGAALVMPPEPSWKDLRVTAVRNWPGAYAVELHLWTANGRTPHTVELTIHTKDGQPVIELDDIIVM